MHPWRGNSTDAAVVNVTKVEKARTILEKCISAQLDWLYWRSHRPCTYSFIYISVGQVLHVPIESVENWDDDSGRDEKHDFQFIV